MSYINFSLDIDPISGDVDNEFILSVPLKIKFEALKHILHFAAA